MSDCMGTIARGTGKGGDEEDESELGDAYENGDLVVDVDDDDDKPAPIDVELAKEHCKPCLFRICITLIYVVQILVHSPKISPTILVSLSSSPSYADSSSTNYIPNQN